MAKYISFSRRALSAVVASIVVLTAVGFILREQSDSGAVEIKAKLTEPPPCHCNIEYRWRDYKLDLAYAEPGRYWSVIDGGSNAQSGSLRGVRLSRNQTTLCEENLSGPLVCPSVSVVTVDGLPEISIDAGDVDYLIAYDRSTKHFGVKCIKEGMRVVFALDSQFLEPIPAINRPALPGSALEDLRAINEKIAVCGPVQASLRVSTAVANDSLTGTFDKLTIRRKDSTFQFAPAMGYQHFERPALLDLDADGEPEVLLSKGESLDHGWPCLASGSNSIFDPKMIIYKYSPQRGAYDEHMILDNFVVCDFNHDQVPEFMRTDVFDNPFTDQKAFSRTRVCQFRNGRMIDIYPKLSADMRSEADRVLEGG